jgi:hypothetical protein
MRIVFEKKVRVFSLSGIDGFTDQSFVPTSLVECGEARTASIEALALTLLLVNNKTVHRVFDKRLTQHNFIN